MTSDRQDIKCVAMIPARAGSKRLKAKNVLPLNGEPLIAYTIGAALKSGVFEQVIVSTDSEEIASIARDYGAGVPFLRPESLAGEKSPDIEWIQHALDYLESAGVDFNAFSILRPTSPFRLPETIQRAMARFLDHQPADSLRAVEKCHQHPGKMWTLEGEYLKPLMDDGGANPPWHSSAYQSLPPVYEQNASLEIAWKEVPRKCGTIAGTEIISFVSEGFEGFDINQPEDFWLAELLTERGKAQLPPVCK